MYLGYQNNKIKFYVEQPLDSEFYPVDEWVETEDEYIQDGDSYVLNDDTYKETQEQKELERIGNLKITKRVFMLGLQQLGISYAQLKNLIAENEQAQMEWDLCVELERKNPLINLMAGQFGIYPETIDYIFRKANGEDVTLTEVEDNG